MPSLELPARGASGRPASSPAATRHGVPALTFQRTSARVFLYNVGVTEYRIDDLAREAGTTVRNIRSYQDRGLLPAPRRQGRTALYDERHLARLRLIGQLLDRGYQLAAIRELTEAWNDGRSLPAVLGLVDEIAGPWSDETPTIITPAELLEMFGAAASLELLASAIAFGLIEPAGDHFRVPSPRLLAIGRELHHDGVPMEAVLNELRQLRTDMERIGARFVELIASHVAERYIDHILEGELSPELQGMIARLKPLAQAAIDAEFARVMSLNAVQYFQNFMRRYVETRTPRRKR